MSDGFLNRIIGVTRFCLAYPSICFPLSIRHGHQGHSTLQQSEYLKKQAAD